VDLGATQPLFGFGVEGAPPVVTADAPTGQCFTGKLDDEKRPTCLAATRDNPARWGPAIVAFPLTAAHVVTSVNFARTHNLCVSVLGTGHDFLNRHDGCPDGMLIRTTLIKSIEWDLDDSRGFGSKAGTVRLGSGLTFSEIGRSASNNNRMIAEGWTHSVGVAGWSTGGGHGPFAGWAGKWFCWLYYYMGAILNSLLVPSALSTLRPCLCYPRFIH
jgi:FAD/FMN-containing dehydrogenase